MTGLLRSVDSHAVATLHPLRHGPSPATGPAQSWLADAHRLVRGWVMSIGERGDEDGLIDWGVVTTNAIGIVVGIALTSATGGIFYLVWRVPAQQAEIIEQLRDMKEDHLQVKSEMVRLQANDRAQDNRLSVVEAKVRHR